MMKAKLMSVLPFLAPGSKAQSEAVKSLVGVADLDFSFESVQAPEQAAGGTEGGAQLSPQAPANTEQQIQQKMANLTTV
jgi:hypothetical protein